MKNKRDFDFKIAQIEQYVKGEYAKKFYRSARISIRKRQKFMNDMTRKVSKKFGKDVLCLVDFNKGGFVTLISPAHIESTDLGRLYNSFTHPQVSYTTHCLERFSERADSDENCIIIMDNYMNDAILTYGENEGYLTCSAGVFAYELDNGRMVVKTYINFKLLSEKQINKFYGSGTATLLPKEFLAEDESQADFMLFDEYTDPPGKPHS